MSAEPRRLDDLIASVADGDPIDWNAVDASSRSEDQRRLLRHLRAIADVAEVHRSAPADVIPATTFVAPIGDAGQMGPCWGHLLLFEQIGAGSFGDVYRARDPWLDREVALKLLKPDSAPDLPAGRILHEAQTLARVRHPNVVTVYGADVNDGRVGLWMELVLGRTLAAVLASGGTFSASEAAIVGQELCRALAAVHAAGLIHRDVNAQNVMREAGGRLVLMDFGAGQLVDGGVTSCPAGTPLYLAPELLNGSDATVQADIYAVGVLLYHLVTGEFPVTGSSLGELRDAHERSERRHLRDARPDLPDAFVGAVEGALNPNPKRRFATAGEMQHVLAKVTSVGLLGRTAPIPVEPSRRWDLSWRRSALFATLVLALAAWISWVLWPTARFGSDSIRLIAVLPLRSAAPETEYLADGMTEALMQGFARVTSLRVVSRTSVMQAQRLDASLPSIAKVLNADAIIEGSVLRSADHVVVNVRLIHARSDTPVWSRTFEQAAENVVALQGDVARSIADELAVALAPTSAFDLAAAQLVNTPAHDAYLRGRYYLRTASEPSFRQAIEQFQLALRLEPRHALAHAGIAQAYLVLGGAFAAMPQQEAYSRARNAVTRALEIDDEVAEAHAVLAEISFEFDWDWAAADREFLRALTLNPSLEFARERYAMFLAARDRMDEAVSEIAQARQVDPLSPVIASGIGVILRYARRYDEAVGQFNSVLASHPDYLGAHIGLARTLNAMGRHDEAIARYRSVGNHSPNQAFFVTEIAQADAAAGRISAARAGVEDLKRNASDRGWLVTPDSYAYVHARLGEKDAAFAWLERAFEARSGAVLWLKVDPRCDPLRDDPRFAGYLSRLGLRP